MGCHTHCTALLPIAVTLIPVQWRALPSGCLGRWAHCPCPARGPCTSNQLLHACLGPLPPPPQNPPPPPAALPSFPFARPAATDPPAEYAALRSKCPISRAKLFDGSPVWLVARLKDLQQALVDNKLSKVGMCVCVAVGAWGGEEGLCGRGRVHFQQNI